MRKRILFFNENSILIHPIVEWRKGNISYEEARDYFDNGLVTGDIESTSKEVLKEVSKEVVTEVIDKVVT